MVRSWFQCRIILGFVAAAVFLSPAASGHAQTGRDLGLAIAAQESNNGRLLAIQDVVGTAVGLTVNGEPAIKVYTRAAGVRGIPRSLDGVPVEVEVTGEIFALHHRPGHSGGPGGGDTSEPSSTSTWPRPVPIGISTGNEGECSAGTIGARVTDGSAVYALSNNHGYALENNAPIGSNVLQPGRYDTNCSIDPLDVMGTLHDYEPINFNCVWVFGWVCDPALDNEIDAAIALSSTGNLDKKTPSNGYGTPTSTPVPAAVDQQVQKYGRTSLLTRGKVTGVNGLILISYSGGTARFKNQIVVSGSKPFIKAGDSGSLLVTDPDLDPVGLLYAGDSSGKTAIANPIGPVLTSFGVTIDGQPIDGQ